MPRSLGDVSVYEEQGEDNGDDNYTDRINKKKKEKKKKKKENRKGHGFKDEESVMPSSSKPRKHLSFKIRRKPNSAKASSSSSSSGLTKGSCFCGMKPPETEEPASPVSDPNDENFTHGMMRALLETDDFCSKECNSFV